MGTVFVVSREESCARAGRVENRDVRVGGFDEGVGEGLSGGAEWRVGFNRDMSCEKLAVRLAMINERSGRKRGWHSWV